MSDFGDFNCKYLAFLQMFFYETYQKWRVLVKWGTYNRLYKYTKEKYTKLLQFFSTFENFLSFLPKFYFILYQTGTNE